MRAGADRNERRIIPTGITHHGQQGRIGQLHLLLHVDALGGEGLNGPLETLAEPDERCADQTVTQHGITCDREGVIAGNDRRTIERRVAPRGGSGQLDERHGRIG